MDTTKRLELNMAKKTWKIGEYCKGGIISVDVKESEVMLYLKDWDFSKGSNAKSDQSNAKVLDEISVSRIKGIGWDNSNAICNKMEETLNDWTTSYYADKIVKWIREKI